MTINDLANVHHANIDNATGETITHREKYKRIIDVLGWEEVKKCIPFSSEEIKKALPKDEHLNNLPLRKWNLAAGFITRNQGQMLPMISQLTNIYRKHGVTCFSCSEGVCILKEAAKMWVESEVTQ